ncbi:type I-E CRISPR-associated protein Cse1/CasA [Enterovirga sp.]|uniref:type I-E CRISPR-associated protein Cse1/CasA n=1 Tax=Enterovirga sp. TaxID=2026350 RepID=UPI002C92B799|nr:type I-E CRISPR-associated protein Cse1/CasA [Enterovirga sp.]HMO28540.1 type I-E CRISPR-associated protein Cse1/CasA [Enterovirga sp.]
MPEPFNLLSQSWLPVLRADGLRYLVRPAEIVSQIGTNPILAPAWGRADFDAATREFWIGLLATACGPQADDRDEAWEEWFRDPPLPEVLDAAFTPFAPAFGLDGDGPRFGQDLDELANGAVKSVSQLLIEAPGDHTVKRNLDHFVRRGGVAILSRAGAAMALFALQTYASKGGAGHRVSVRGGGPLTTLLVPGPFQGEARDARVPLWRTLWLATAGRDEPPAAERVFPWLVPTRVSDKGRITTPSDVDPLQAFWGMPRRIRLVFEANPDGCPCDLTGRIDPVVVRTYRTRPHGTSYAAFLHPLSPHYRTKPGEPLLPLHGQPGGVGYRHWVGLVANDVPEEAKATRQIAACVETGRRRLFGLDASVGRGTRLLAAGFDMDNMKARAFVESEMPLHLVGGATFAALDRTIRFLISGAREAEAITRLFVRQALFVKRTQVADGFTGAPKDGGALDLARARFWERTEAAFGVTLAGLAEKLRAANADVQAIEQDTPKGWLATLQRAAFDVFDELVSLDDLDGLDERSARARIEARNDLHGALRGYGKIGQNLFKALNMAPPTPAKRSKA